MLHRRLFRRALSHAARLADSTIQLTRRRTGAPFTATAVDASPDASAYSATAPTMPVRSAPGPSPVASPTEVAARPTPVVAGRAPGKPSAQAASAEAAERRLQDAITASPRDGDDSTALVVHHQRGLAMARAYRWNWAQRELELAARAGAGDPARSDLETVRAARRYLRALQKRPHDAQTRMLLGQCYFELDMGEDAEREFRYAMAIATEAPEPPYFLALEYCYRGMFDEAERCYAQAQRRVDGLPPFATLLDECRRALGDEAAHDQAHPSNGDHLA